MRFTGYLLTLFSLAICGCGSNEFELQPVSGIVQLDGKPITGARVIFSPQRTGKEALAAGPSSDGLTDDTGRYSLVTSIQGDPGAVVGSHTVTISTYMAKSDREHDTHTVVRKEEIPSKYQAPGALTFDVPAGGTEQADFDLASRRK